MPYLLLIKKYQNNYFNVFLIFNNDEPIFSKIYNNYLKNITFIRLIFGTLGTGYHFLRMRIVKALNWFKNCIIYHSTNYLVQEKTNFIQKYNKIFI